MEHARPSLYARLVDRYAGLTTWPTARKTVFASSVALAFHCVISPLVVIGATNVSDTLDVAALWWLVAYGALAAVVALVYSLLVWRRREEGRHTVYVLVVGYGAFLVGIVVALGTVSTALFALLPLVILFVTVYFDGRAGVVACAYFVLLLASIGFGEVSGWLPYAPGVLDRTLDTQTAPWWYGSVLATVAAVFAYAFVMVQLAVSARAAQERRLEAAHRALGQANDALRRGNDLIRRYVPADLAEELLAGHGPGGGHRRRTLTIVFSDIAGFAEIADQLEAEDLANLLNEYFAEMAAIAESHGGLVNKFIGDAMLILFGAAAGGDRKAEAVRAVEMALAMQARVDQLGRKWHDDGLLVPVRIRIGINTGAASLGDFGSEGRRDYTAVGNQVNVAARIQAHGEPGEVLLSHATWALVRDHVACVEGDDITVKGIHYPIRVYRARAVAGA